METHHFHIKKTFFLMKADT